MSDTPSDDDLSAIKRSIPDLKKLVAGRRQAKQAAAKPAGPFCIICGQSYKIFVKESPHKTCAECQSKLDEGQTAVVCPSVDMKEMRFAFIMADNNPQAQKLKGQIIGVDNATMQAIFDKKKLEEPSQN